MSRRCLICANINPCALHTDANQAAELRRNMAEIRAYEATDRIKDQSHGG